MSFLSGANLGPPGKPHQLEDSYSPYNMMSSSESPTSPLVPQDSWGQGKSSTEKMANGTNINWPPGKNTHQKFGLNFGRLKKICAFKFNF